MQKADGLLFSISAVLFPCVPGWLFTPSSRAAVWGENAPCALRAQARSKEEEGKRTGSALRAQVRREKEEGRSAVRPLRGRAVERMGARLEAAPPEVLRRFFKRFCGTSGGAASCRAICPRDNAGGARGPCGRKEEVRRKKEEVRCVLRAGRGRRTAPGQRLLAGEKEIALTWSGV